MMTHWSVLNGAHVLHEGRLLDIVNSWLWPLLLYHYSRDLIVLRQLKLKLLLLIVDTAVVATSYDNDCTKRGT